MPEGTVWAGLTVEELIDITMKFLEEVTSEYADDKKLSAKEIVKILGAGDDDGKGLFLHLGEHAEGTAATAFNSVGQIMKWILPLVPGDD